MARFCTHCGTALEDGVAFCTQCGQKVEKGGVASPICPQCGAALEDGAAFCIACGASVAVSQTMQMPVVAPSSASAHPMSTASMPYATTSTGAWTAPTAPRTNKLPLAVASGLLFVLAAVAIAVFAFDPFGWRGGASADDQASTVTLSSVDSGADEDTEASDEADDISTSDASSTLSDDDDESSALSSSDDHDTGVNAASTGDDYYVLPESSERVYSASELAGLSAWDLNVARNEIYARYGRGFNNENLQSYFNSKSWYTRRYSPEDFDAMESPLTDIELANVKVIQSLE